MSLAHEINDTVRTDDVIVTEDITFEGMILSDKTLNGLNAAGFRRPSPVQLHAIPIGKCGFDLLIEAKSGTGKTAVFAVIALEMLELNNNLQVVVLAPTREIAHQVHDVIKTIGCKYKDLSVEVVMGGTSLGEDKNKFSKLSKPQIIVGSPGRFRHLIQDNIINVSSVRLFVMDEADKLMEDSFQADVNYIFSKLPERKQVIANSATYTDALRTFVGRYMRSPSHIKPNSSSVLLGVKQNITRVDCHENVMKQVSIKYSELKNILENTPFKQCLVFCNYQKRAKDLCSLLKRDGWPAEYLAGNQTQNERLAGLKNLQEFKCRILIATDLASRGIDAANVDLVINFELPYDVATYLHRIGRAGRYGSYGATTSIVVRGKEEDDFKKMLAVLGENVKLIDLCTADDFKLNAADEHIIPNCNLQNNEVVDAKGDMLDSEVVSSLHEYMCKDFLSTNTDKSFKVLLESFNQFEIGSDLNEPLNTHNIEPVIQEMPTKVSNRIKYYVDNIFFHGYNNDLNKKTFTKENCRSASNEEEIYLTHDNVSEKLFDECIETNNKVRRKQKRRKQMNVEESIYQMYANIAGIQLENSEVSVESYGDRTSDDHLRYEDKIYSYHTDPKIERNNVKNDDYKSYYVPEGNKAEGYYNKNYFDANHPQRNKQFKKRTNKSKKFVEKQTYQHSQLFNAPNRRNFHEQTADCTNSSSSERKTQQCHRRKERIKYEDYSNVIRTEYEVWRSQLALIASQIQQTVYVYEMCRK